MKGGCSLPCIQSVDQIGRNSCPSFIVRIFGNSWVLALESRTKKDIQDEANTISASGGKAGIAMAHVGNMDSVNGAVKSLEAQLGYSDILINNAGTGKFAKFMDLEPAESENQVKVNLLGVYCVTRVVLPQMLERQVFCKRTIVECY